MYCRTVRLYREEGIIITHRLIKKISKLVDVNDNPVKLTKSMSLGFFLAFLPLPGLNLPIGILLAKLFRLNVVATSVPALLLTYVSPFIYIFNYKIGRFFIATSEKPPQGFIVDLTFWDRITSFFTQAGPAYLLGSAINATLVGIISYLLFYTIFKNIHEVMASNQSLEIEQPQDI